MARIEVTRHVAADPAGVALLLAEPASWPDPDHPVLPDHHWNVAAPQRLGNGFRSAAEFTEPSGRRANAEVTVMRSTTAGSDIRVVIGGHDRMSTRRLERSAARFLALLADRAQARAFAA